MRRFLVFALLAAMLLPLSTRAQDETFEVGQVVVVDVDIAHVRAAPGTDSHVLTTLFRGDELKIFQIPPEIVDGESWWKLVVVGQAITGWLPDTKFSALDSLRGETAVATDPTCWTDDQLTEVGGVPNWSAPPAMVIDPLGRYIATISTTKGEIVVELDAEVAPIATNNFYCLATAGYYDGTDFHRISENFLIQGGDPTGTGTGTPGYTVPSDPTTGPYPAGSIALANREADQNGAQFFIAVSDLTGQIPDQYPVFGQVISGMDVVTDISSGPVEPNSRGELSSPLYPTTIVSIAIGLVEDEIGPPLQPQTAGPAIEPTVAVAPTVAIPPTETTVIEIEAMDIAFDPTEITIDAADLPVTIRMENTGAALHNFKIEELGIDVDAFPNETVDIVIPAGTAPGAYEFICNVPGHKEAGQVGTLFINGAATSTTPVATTAAETGCADFATYQEAYDGALLAAFFANPESFEILDRLDTEGDAALEAFTNAEFAILEQLFGDMARELTAVVPPAYAAEWHALLIETYEVVAEMFADSQVVGPEAAAINHFSELTRLDNEVTQALAVPGICSEFVVWATEET